VVIDAVRTAPATTGGAKLSENFRSVAETSGWRVARAFQTEEMAATAMETMASPIQIPSHRPGTVS